MLHSNLYIKSVTSESYFWTSVASRLKTNKPAICFQVTEEGDDQQACPTLQQIEENVQNWGQVEPELDEERSELGEEGVEDNNEEHIEGAEKVVEGSPVS